MEEFNFSDEDDIDRDQFNKADTGISGDFGFSFDPFLIGTAYNYGLVEVKESDEILEALLQDTINNTSRVYLGLKF